VSTASEGAPLLATCLRRLGEGDSSDDCIPAVGESAANSRSTGPPVLGDWKNDTLRMDRVLRRVDTVAVEEVAAVTVTGRRLADGGLTGGVVHGCAAEDGSSESPAAHPIGAPASPARMAVECRAGGSAEGRPP